MTSKCSFDPTKYVNVPIGMFHCPLCGEMVLAGAPHPDYENLDEDYAEYLKANPIQDEEDDYGFEDIGFH